MNLIFRGSIKKGKLILDDPAKYLVHLASFEDKRIELVLRKKQSQRSINQNNYYWGVVVRILADFCGYTDDEMHQALKIEFLSTKIADDKGLMRVGSTAKLNTDEFVQYTNNIVRWAAETYGVFIPDPHEVG